MGSKGKQVFGMETRIWRFADQTETFIVLILETMLDSVLFPEGSARQRSRGSFPMMKH